MPILRQIAEAFAAAIENFFSVPWQSVVCLLVAIAALGYFAYLRTLYYGHHFVLQTLVLLCALGAVRGVQHFGKR